MSWWRASTSTSRATAASPSRSSPTGGATSSRRTPATTPPATTPACATGTPPRATFIAPRPLNPNNRDRLYVGAASLWVTNNPRAPTPIWTAAKDPTGNANYINAVAVAESDSNTVWVGHNNGEVYRSNDATLGGPTWTR